MTQKSDHMYRKYKGTINVRLCNLFYILYYAFCADWAWPDLSELETVVPDEEFENLQDLFSGVLESHIAKLLKQGLHREYLDKTEDIPVLRGKIDMVGTIRNRIARRQLLSCEYDELSENTLNNRIIKTAVNFLLHKGEMKSEREDSLRQEMRYFSNVEEIRNLASIQWSRLHFHRNNKDYRILIFVCRLILKELLLTTEDGEYELESFVSAGRMNTLYEKFILGYYQTTFSTELEANASWIAWARPDDKKVKELEKGLEILPGMHSDIMLTYPPNKKKPSKVLIIDAKWYKNILLKFKKKEAPSEQKDQTGDDDEDHGITYDENNGGKIRSGHLYQIFSYVKNKYLEVNGDGDNNCEVSGMLLYAGTTEVPQLDAAYNMSRNWIYVKTLDLSKKFEGTKDEPGVREQLDKIANKFLSSKEKEQ